MASQEPGVSYLVCDINFYVAEFTSGPKVLGLSGNSYGRCRNSKEVPYMSHEEDQGQFDVQCSILLEFNMPPELSMPACQHPNADDVLVRPAKAKMWAMP